MSERVREIQFANFRGLPNYSCLLKGKNIVVLGGNGKGKSGIVDGIEFLFSGTIARFHGEGTGNINSEEAICHVQKKGEPVVELYFTPTNDKVKRSLSDTQLQIPSKPTIEAYITFHPPVESFILRRAQILNFIYDQDANRYRKYIQLLGLTDIDNMQRAFVEAARLSEDQLATARQLLSTELAVFTERISGWIPTTLDSLLMHCSELAGQLGIQELTNWEHLGSVISALESRRSPEITAQVDALNRGILSFEREMPAGLSSLVTSANEIQIVLARLRAASEVAAASGIIREGLVFFDEHREATICPLCEKPLDEGYADVLERLRKRSEALTQLRQNEERMSQVLDQLVTRVQQSADQLAKDLENESLISPGDVASLRNARASLLRWLRLLKRRTRDHSCGEIVIPDRLEPVAALRQRLLIDLTNRRTALIPADAAQLENAIALLNKAKLSVPRLRDAENRFHKSAGKSAVANQSRDAFSTAREKAIQLIFDQIADKVLQYYKKLHEIDSAAETSECTELDLTATPRAAAGGLRLVIQFLGLAGSSDPRAFLSEGHLDSLGLCLYLATVRMFNPPGTLLVLDDVLTSIDKEHRHRVAELLFEQFSDFQIVLTTHDEHWFGILKTMAQARGDQGNWIFKTIARWTLDGGPESKEFESTWSYLEANLIEDAYRELGGPLRLVFEDFIKRVAAKVELKIKYKFDGKYTSGDFMGIEKEIREGLLTACPAVEEAGIKHDIGRVFGTGDLINFLSHDNPGRLEVTLTQTTDFVLGLSSLIVRCRDNKLMKGVST